MAFVTVDGARYELPTQNDLTPKEFCLAWDMGARPPENGNGGFDPHWIVPLIVIAKQRAGEVLTPAAMDALGDIPFAEMAWEEDADPPMNRAARRAVGVDGAAKTAPAPSGSPSTPNSSASIPG